MKYWEFSNLENAQAEKTRLEINQRKRREILKNQLRLDPNL